MNIRKTELYWPSPDSRSPGLFPSHISRPLTGVKLSGGPVRTNSEFCMDLVHKRVQKTVSLMEAVSKLEDPQCELLLLRNCSGVSRLYFTLRTTLPGFMDSAMETFDSHLFQFLRHIITGDGPGYGLLQHRIVTLPLKYGGLGTYSMTDTRSYCYLASCLQTFALQNSILRNSGIDPAGPCFSTALHDFNVACSATLLLPGLEEVAPVHSMSSLATIYFDTVVKSLPTSFNMSERDKILWQCNQVQHAQDYLLAVPIEGLGQKIGPRHFSAILKYRLGISFFDEDGICPSCSSEMDKFGDHAVHCKNDLGLKFRHDLIRDIFIDICYRVGVPARKEVDLGFVSDNGTCLRPADILVLNWDEGRDVCLDVTVVSPFTGNGVRSFVPGQAIDKAVSRKRKKYLDKCTAQGFGFGTLAFSTLGELGVETIDFLKRLPNFSASHDANVRVGNFLFQRIVVALQRGIGTQLVSRVPTNFLKEPDVEL